MSVTDEPLTATGLKLARFTVDPPTLTVNAFPAGTDPLFSATL